MLHVCENFSEARDIVFNPRKTVCIHFSPTSNSVDISSVRLCGQTLSWSDKVSHLGNILTENLREDDEVARKMSDFIYHANTIRAKFPTSTHETKEKLFRTFCCVFYGSQAWNLSQQACLSKAITRFNVTVRRLFKLPPRTHRALIPGITRCPPLLEQLSRRFTKINNQMNSSPNSIVHFCTQFFQDDPRSITSLNLVETNRERDTIVISTNDEANANLIRCIITSNFQSDLLSYAEMLF